MVDILIHSIYNFVRNVPDHRTNIYQGLDSNRQQITYDTINRDQGRLLFAYLSNASTFNITALFVKHT